MKKIISMLVLGAVILVQFLSPISISAATDDTITKIEVDDIVWFTGIHGHNVTETDENGQNHTYFKYTGFGSELLYDPCVSIKVHRTTDFFGPSTVNFYGEDTLDMITDQSYDNQWKPGNTYVAKINYLGYSCNVNITIRDAVFYDYTVRDNEAYITGWGEDTNRLRILDAVIPDEINGYTVAGIDYLSGRPTRIYSLVIPDSLRAIKPTSLKDLTTVDTVYLGKSISDISPRTFSSMTKLKEIVVSSENPYYTAIDGVLYSRDVSKFIAYPIAKGNTYVMDERATDIQNILYYTDVSFYGVNKPIELVTVDGMVYTSDMKVLVSCSASQYTYVMPNSVEIIMPGALKNAKYIKSLTISSNAYEIPEYFMEGCTLLESVTMPNSVEIVGERAFYGCEKLSSVSWSKNLEEIGKEAFMNTSPVTLKLPDSVEVIGDSAFENTKITGHVISNGLKGIGDRVFANNKEIETIELGRNVQSIGKYAFEGCTSLRKVNGAESVLYMEEGAFMNCSSLEEVPIGKKQTKISPYLFSGCTSIKSIELSNEITDIGDDAFSGCTSLESANIPDSAVNVGDEVFYECTSLKTASIGKNQTSVGILMFGYCKNLENVVIPENITAIEDRAFEGCVNMKSITMTDNIDSIGIWVFEYCDLLNTIYFVGDESGWNTIDNKSSYYTDNCNKLYLSVIDGRALSVNGKTGYYSYGDVDADGEITALDVLAIKKYCASVFSEGDLGIEVADINHDYKVNAKDLLHIKRMLEV